MSTETGHLSLVVQRIVNDIQTPADEDFHLWAATVIEHSRREGLLPVHELTIRLVGETESRELNARYRKKDTATNVLSFPAELPEQLREVLMDESGSWVLGDLVICVPVVTREAQEQNKPESNHWAHLVVHGVLHLLGHDHVEPGQAERMEKLERQLLAGLGIDDPYRVR